MSILGIIAGIIIVCLVFWAVPKLLGAFNVQEPVRTVVWVVVVVLAVLLFLQLSGIYPFATHVPLR